MKFSGREPAHRPIFHPWASAMPKAVAVAWSGGADSTALLWMLVQAGFDVQAWHVDHQWHAQSSDVADRLAARALSWGIPFYVQTIAKPTRNLEAESRQSRYAAFDQLARQTGCYHLLVAHQADDQAETVCMRLLQGAGVAGCRGMQVHRQHGALHLWRPLLDWTRQQIEDYLQQFQLPWEHDHTNDDTSLWRNAIRHRLFKTMLMHGVEPKHLFLRWQKQAVLLQGAISTLAEAVDVRTHNTAQGEVVEVNWHGWCLQSKPVRMFIMQKMMGLLFADGRVMGRRHLSAVEAWRSHGGKSWLNLSRCCLYRRGEGLQLCHGKVSLRDTFLQSIEVKIDE